MIEEEENFIKKFVEEIWNNERRNINILEFEDLMGIILIRRGLDKNENSSRNRRRNSRQRKRR